MPKFFISKEDICNNAVTIKGEDVSHIKRVLRLKCGDTLQVCDGAGTDYTVRVENFEKDCIIAGIISSERNNAEPPIDIVLFQGIPKSDKMDFIIQKSVELGVKSIIPVSTDRTVVKIANEKDAGVKTARWQKIALEASKQCNRGTIPHIGVPVSFEDALRQASDTAELCIIPYEKETGSFLKPIIKGSKTKRIAVFVGPEGGFTENEVRRSQDFNIRPITLGPRILRTETAGIAVISILMYELGDLGNE
ncbi:16S rRNA (uracil(1498)-N(3))-methyltransferase [Anaerobacterium chartisolvens]|nr:16S rRNA (uracil(1498)-N(3))-methyltransferase [Anaerobacterium chartisolvens]